MWRIISHDSLSQCETEILTFYAAPSEAFKMGLLDEILVEPSEI
jgi:hypothetical protein